MLLVLSFFTIGTVKEPSASVNPVIQSGSSFLDDELSIFPVIEFVIQLEEQALVVFGTLEAELVASVEKEVVPIDQQNSFKK